MAIGTILDRANRSKIQFGDGAPTSTTRGNIYIDDTVGNLYIKYNSTWTLVVGGAGGFSYIKRDGGTSLTDYAILYEGDGITLSDGTHGITISNSGILTINSTEPDEYGNIVITEFGPHSDTHEDGGSDEIDVTDLSGVLADPQDAGSFLGVDIAIGAPDNGDVYIYNSTSGEWEAGPASGSAYDDTPVFYKDGSRVATGDFDLDTHDLNNVVEIKSPTTTTMSFMSDDSSAGISVSSDKEVSFWDTYHGSSNWLASMPFSNSIGEWNDARTVLGGADGSLLALIMAASGASPTLEATAIGFGSGSNLLTGDATKFSFDSVNNRINVASVSSLQMNAAASINLGGTTTGTFGKILFNTNQTSANCLTIATNSASNNLIISSVSNYGANFSHGAQTNPTLWIHSSSATANRNLSISHDQSNAIVSSSFGSIGFNDLNRSSGSTWTTTSRILLSTSYGEWTGLKELIGSEGSVFAGILAASETAYLEDGAVGYGSLTDSLTGSTSKLSFDYTNNRLGITKAVPAVGLHVGSGTPNRVSSSPTSNDTYITARLEVDGVSYFDADVQINSSINLADNIPIRFGSLPDAQLFYSVSVNSPDTLVFGLPATSRSLVFCEMADIGINWAKTLQTNPTLYIQSSSSTNSQFLSLAHDASNGVVTSGTGSIQFNDAYKHVTWATTGIRLSTNSTEWTGIKTLLGGTEGSILGAILAASLTGGTGVAPALATNAVGYGVAGLLSGDSSKLFFDYTNTRLGIGKANPNVGLHVGSSTPGHLAASTNNAFVSGQLEVNGYSYFDSNSIYSDDTYIYFGTGNDAFVTYKANTLSNDAFMIGLSTDSQSLFICRSGDSGTNFSHGAQINPTLYIQSGATTLSSYLSLSHTKIDGFIASGTGSIMFSDAYRTASGSTWSSSGIRLFSNATEWADIETLIGSEGSIAKAILNASNDAPLLSTAVGYGDSGNKITGNPNYFKYTTSRQLMIGNGTPNRIGTSNDSIYIKGFLEVDNAACFDGTVWIYNNSIHQDNVPAYFGTGITSDSCLMWSTSQTYDSLVIGVGGGSKSIIVCDTADRSYNFGHNAQTHPTLYLHSSNQNSYQTLKLQHNGVQSRIDSALGGFSFENSPATSTNSIGGLYNIGLGSHLTVSGSGTERCILAGYNLQNNGVSYSQVYGRYAAAKWEGTRHFAGRQLGSDAIGTSQAMDGLCLTAQTSTTNSYSYSSNVPLYFNNSTPFYVPSGHVCCLKMMLMSSDSVSSSGGFKYRDFTISLLNATACFSTKNEQIISGIGVGALSVDLIITDNNAGTFTFYVRHTGVTSSAVKHVAHVISAVITKCVSNTPC